MCPKFQLLGSVAPSPPPSKHAYDCSPFIQTGLIPRIRSKLGRIPIIDRYACVGFINSSQKSYLPYHDDRERHGQTRHPAKERGGADQCKRSRINPRPVNLTRNIWIVHPKPIHHCLPDDPSVQTADQPEHYTVQLYRACRGINKCILYYTVARSQKFPVSGTGDSWWLLSKGHGHLPRHLTPVTFPLGPFASRSSTLRANSWTPIPNMNRRVCVALVDDVLAKTDGDKCSQDNGPGSNYSTTGILTQFQFNQSRFGSWAILNNRPSRSQNWEQASTSTFSHTNQNKRMVLIEYDRILGK